MDLLALAVAGLVGMAGMAALLYRLRHLIGTLRRIGAAADEAATTPAPAPAPAPV
jgi:hypothetical protein